MKPEEARTTSGPEAAFLTGTVAAMFFAGAEDAEAQLSGDESPAERKWRRQVEKTERKVSRLLEKTLEKMDELDELYEDGPATGGGILCQAK